MEWLSNNWFELIALGLLSWIAFISWAINDNLLHITSSAQNSMFTLQDIKGLLQKKRLS